MNSRDKILARLKKISSLKTASPIPAWQDKDIYSDYPSARLELITEFKKHIQILAGELHVFDTVESLAAALPPLLHDIDPERCKSHQSSLIESVKKANPEVVPYLTHIDTKTIDSVSFADFEVGISGAEFLVARTGSILLQAISAGGRRLSVLPPTHIVISETSRLVFSLDEALSRLEENSEPWSYATFITGPSRTSDIEKQLVLGAHGPKKLIILLLNNTVDPM